MSNCGFGQMEEKSSSEIAVTSAPVSTFIMTGVPATDVFFLHADDVSWRAPRKADESPKSSTIAPIDWWGLDLHTAAKCPCFLHSAHVASRAGHLGRGWVSLPHQEQVFACWGDPVDPVVICPDFRVRWRCPCFLSHGAVLWRAAKSEVAGVLVDPHTVVCCARTASLFRAMARAFFRSKSESNCSLSDSLESRNPTTRRSRIICSFNPSYSQCSTRA